MLSKDPCLNCLVKPCCRERCEEKEKFLSFSNHVLPIIFIILSFIIVISCIYLIILLDISSGLKAVFILLFWFSTFLFSKEMVENDNYNNNQSMEILEYWFMFSVSPLFCFIAFMIYAYQIYTEIDPKLI